MSELMGIIQILISAGIAAILISLFLLLTYRKQKKPLIWVLVIILVALVSVLLVVISIDLIDILQMLLITGNIVILIAVLLLMTYRKHEKTRIWVLTIISGMLVVTLIILIIWISLSEYIPSFHVLIILGLPALIVLTVGTILVVYDESKYVLYHGFGAGSSWIITLTNVILLITLTPQMMTDYSGWIHTFHIVAGAIGLGAGFASMLFGISGQRYNAKLTGFITLGCWWGAFLLGFFIQGIL
ncbi:MAG: hypothetical protein WBH31_01825 [Promethearchaeia archaeon]